MATPESKLHPLNYLLPHELRGDHEAPCLSLYLPTRRSYPDNQENPIRYRNLLKKLESSLAVKYQAPELPAFLEPFERLAKDGVFWRKALDGLAVFGSRDVFKVIRLHRTVPERAVAGQSFYLKPLRRVLQATDRYQVLGLTRGSIRLFEGTRDILDEIETAPEVPRTMEEALGSELDGPHLTVASYGGAGGEAMHHGHGGKPDAVDTDAEKFFRTIDRAVAEHHSGPSGLPLVLAALPEHQALFRKISKNRHLLKEGVPVDPGRLPPEKIRERAWDVIEPIYLEHLRSLGGKYREAFSKRQGSHDPEEVSKAVIEGRVGTLLVEAFRRIPGSLEDETGAIRWAEPSDPAAEDLLDDLGEVVEKMGGQVLVVEKDLMPVETGLAAIYRF